MQPLAFRNVKVEKVWLHYIGMSAEIFQTLTVFTWVWGAFALKKASSNRKAELLRSSNFLNQNLINYIGVDCAGIYSKSLFLDSRNTPRYAN